LPRRGCVAELAANNAQVFVGLAALLELYVKDHQLPWTDQSRVRLQEFLPWAAQTLGPVPFAEADEEARDAWRHFDEVFLARVPVGQETLDYLRETFQCAPCSCRGSR
jgi:hypothetical protein